MSADNRIKITQGGKVIAHHTVESSLSHYGQPVFVVEDAEPEPGPVVFTQGDHQVQLDAIEVRGGWLVCRQPGGLLVGILWSDGKYFANVIEDQAGEPQTEWKAGAGLRVRDTVQLDPTDPEDLGAIFC